MNHQSVTIGSLQTPQHAETFPHLPDDDFGTRHNRLKFSPHEHLFIQGDRPTGIYEVLSGTVIIYKVMADGRRQIQDFATEGDLLALTFTDRHDLSAEALTEVETRFVPRAVFDNALQNSPSFRKDIFALISTKLQAAREQALLLGRKCAKERTATFLLFLESRFRDQEAGFVEIRMSRCDMADYLGLTLETVSRMMSRLKKEGVIALPQPNRFRILDRGRLVACAGDTEEDDVLYAA